LKCFGEFPYAPFQIVRGAFGEPQAARVAWQGDVDKVTDDWKIEDAPGTSAGFRVSAMRRKRRLQDGCLAPPRLRQRHPPVVAPFRTISRLASHVRIDVFRIKASPRA
jgi:hypothetical protein